MRSCVRAYRDKSKLVSCKIEHFAETPDRRRFIHTNFLVTFGCGRIVLNYTASLGHPPQVGKRGTSIVATSLDIQGSDDALDISGWQSGNTGEYAIRYCMLTDANLDEIDLGIAHLTEKPYFATVVTEDGNVEKFLVFDPKPDDGIATQFRAAFDALNRECRCGPPNLPRSLLDNPSSSIRQQPEAIRNLAYLLGCAPPSDSSGDCPMPSTVWRRGHLSSRKLEIKRDGEGNAVAVCLTQIVEVDGGPETLAIITSALPGEGRLLIHQMVSRLIDTKRPRSADDDSPFRIAWQFGSDGRFDTRDWNLDIAENTVHRDTTSDEIGPEGLDTCLLHATTLPYLAVIETERGMRWQCLALHSETESGLADEFRSLLDDLCAGRTT